MRFPFNISRGFNVHGHEGLPDYGIYDARIGRHRGQRIYTKAFAETLVEAMNWAYEQGKKDERSNR